MARRALDIRVSFNHHSLNQSAVWDNLFIIYSLHNLRIFLRHAFVTFFPFHYISPVRALPIIASLFGTVPRGLRPGWRSHLIISPCACASCASCEVFPVSSRSCFLTTVHRHRPPYHYCCRSFRHSVDGDTFRGLGELLLAYRNTHTHT
jgi:hypothetical protein